MNPRGRPSAAFRFSLSAALWVAFATPVLAAPDIPVSTLAEDEAETAIAINPTNPQNLLATWIDRVAPHSLIAHAYSLDGGATWSASSSSRMVMASLSPTRMRGAEDRDKRERPDRPVRKTSAGRDVPPIRNGS